MSRISSTQLKLKIKKMAAIAMAMLPRASLLSTPAGSKF
jgi:hypothetical protein